MASLFWWGNFTLSHPLFAQERIIGPGEYTGSIVNEGNQSFKISSIKSGQTLQVSLTPDWVVENGGRMKWRIEDQDGAKLCIGSLDSPQVEPVSMEWTSNSEPKPEAYHIYIQGTGGTSPGEILGQYTLRVLLWDQNDGDSGTDAPESYEKALLLPVSDPGTYLFEECFISGTADIYDIYKIILKPNHSLTFRASPLLWKGKGPRGQVRWEFLNKALRRLKEGNSPFAKSNPFLVKVFNPQVKTDTRPAVFYLLVKIEGEISLVYSLQAEIKEGR